MRRVRTHRRKSRHRHCPLRRWNSWLFLDEFQTVVLRSSNDSTFAATDDSQSLGLRSRCCSRTMVDESSSASLSCCSRISEWSNNKFWLAFGHRFGQDGPQRTDQAAVRCNYQAAGSSTFVCCCFPVIQITMSSNKKIKTRRILRRAELATLGEISGSRKMRGAKLRGFARLLWDPYAARKTQTSRPQAPNGASWATPRCMFRCGSRNSNSCIAAFQSIDHILPGATRLAYSDTRNERTTIRCATTASIRYGKRYYGREFGAGGS
jgi:hypothetical protein